MSEKELHLPSDSVIRTCVGRIYIKAGVELIRKHSGGERDAALLVLDTAHDLMRVAADIANWPWPEGAYVDDDPSDPRFSEDVLESASEEALSPFMSEHLRQDLLYLSKYAAIRAAGLPSRDKATDPPEPTE